MVAKQVELGGIDPAENVHRRVATPFANDLSSVEKTDASKPELS